MKPNNNDYTSELPVDTSGSDSLNIDYKRVMYRALRYWYWIVLSLCVAFVVAYLHNRYATRIYPVNASVIVKEADDISGAELIYNNPLLNPKRNYLNETYILKSFPLLQKVVEDLNFDVAFYRKGNILTTESYDELPVDVVPIREKSSGSASFYFHISDKNSFELLPSTEAPGKSFRFNFGDTVSIAGFTGIFYLKIPAQFSSMPSDPIVFTYTPSFDVARRYAGTVKAEWAEEGAGVLNLAIAGSNRQKGVDFLAGLISRYQKYDLDKKNQTAERTVEFIDSQ
ncbi:MAG TPA: capsular biosynthesis protein, partial [Chryseosolibacter sp.]